MIKSLKIKNFCSFKDEVSLSLNEDETKTNSNVFFVLGHNASGKTNFLKSVSFLKWLILYSFRLQEPKKPLPLDPYYFVDKGKEDKTTSFEVVFSSKEDTYKYFIELNEEQIIHEQLWIQNRNERVTFSTLFSRKLNKNKKKYDLSIKNFSLNEATVDKLVRKNCTLLSFAKYSEDPSVKPILDFWENVSSNINYMGKYRNDEFADIIRVSKIYNDNETLFKKVVNLLKSYDFGISDIEIVERERSEKGEKYYLPIMFHKRSDSDKPYPLPIFFESSGSKSLFVILMNIVETLDNGGIVMLDEVDGELHPLLVEEIVDLFMKKSTNKKDAQIILSTHNPNLINLVGKNQIILVEKNSNLESEVFKVSDIKGVRNDENFMAKYLAGSYGAVMKG